LHLLFVAQFRGQAGYDDAQRDLIMPSKKIRLIVGLGNPGDTYHETRHNAGFLVLDKVAETFSIAWDKRKFDVVMGRGMIGTREVILAKPQAYMNRSGPPVLKLANYFKISCEEMLIVHDDIDLTFGRIKIKENGGHGGHNGLRSLIDAFGGGILRGSGSASGVPRHLPLRITFWESLMLQKIASLTKSSAIPGMQLSRSSTKACRKV